MNNSIEEQQKAVAALRKNLEDAELNLKKLETEIPPKPSAEFLEKDPGYELTGECRIPQRDDQFVSESGLLVLAGPGVAHSRYGGRRWILRSVAKEACPFAVGDWIQIPKPHGCGPGFRIGQITGAPCRGRIFGELNNYFSFDRTWWHHCQKISAPPTPEWIARNANGLKVRGFGLPKRGERWFSSFSDHPVIAFDNYEDTPSNYSWILEPTHRPYTLDELVERIKRAQNAYVCPKGKTGTQESSQVLIGFACSSMPIFLRRWAESDVEQCSLADLLDKYTWASSPEPECGVPLG